jgi:uncharacterized protein
MAYKFKIVDRKNDQFGVQFLYNAEVMVWSESYKSKSSAKNCVESLKKHVADAATVDLSNDEKGSGYRFEIKKSKDGQFHVVFVASNGEPMVQSELYTAKASARNCIESCKKNIPAAELIDET